MTILNTRNARENLKPCVAQLDDLKVRLDAMYQKLCFAVETGSEEVDGEIEQRLEDVLKTIDEATDIIENAAHEVDDIRIELEYHTGMEVEA